jgi:serine/threonine-protein kinase
MKEKNNHLFWRTYAIVATLVSALVPQHANADDRTIAQQAFQEGRELMANGRVAEACPKFEAAMRLSNTPGVRLNLALCYEKLGRMASAWGKAHEALDLAERGGDAQAAAVARDQMTALKPKLSYLTIDVDRNSAPRGLQITLDGATVPDAVWGTAFPEDPGEHEVVARAPRYKPWTAKAAVGETAAHARVSVPALKPETAPAASATAREPTQPSERAPSGASANSVRVAALAAGGLGVAGLAVGTVFGLRALSKKSAYEERQVAGRCVDDPCVVASQDAVTAATASTIFFIAGAAMAAAGVTLWIAASSKDGPRPSVALQVTETAQGIGARVSGTW